MLGSEHGNACLAEVGNAFKDRSCCQMAPCVQDATILVDAFDVDAQLLFQHVDFLVECQRLSAEEPRTAKCGAADHHGVDTILRKGSVGLLQRVNVAVANDGNMDARIALHLAYESPVGLSCVHL